MDGKHNVAVHRVVVLHVQDRKISRLHSLVVLNHSQLLRRVPD
jgi:hypothetical protein